jgi:hypothetical protein
MAFVRQGCALALSVTLWAVAAQTEDQAPATAGTKVIHHPSVERVHPVGVMVHRLGHRAGKPFTTRTTRPEAA